MKKPKTPFVSDIELSYKPTIILREQAQIRQSSDAEPLFRSMIPEGQITLREYFLVLLLNRCNRVIGRSIIAIGGMNTCVVDPKIVFMTVLASAAHGFILSHNHPSSTIQPSQADIQLTKRLSEGANILDLQLLDHIILSGDAAGDPVSGRTYLSFAEEGLL